MPLLLSNIQQELTNLMDANAVGFMGYPSNSVQVATNWATAIDNYAKLVVPVSTSFAVAKSAFIATLSGATAPNSFIPLLENAINSYATTLGTGMQPAFTPTPPPVPISLAPLVALPLNVPIGPRISLLATIIHTYFKTGSATNNSSSLVVPWT